MDSKRVKTKQSKKKVDKAMDFDVCANKFMEMLNPDLCGFPESEEIVKVMKIKKYAFEVQNKKMKYADSRPIPIEDGKHDGNLILSNGDKIPLFFNVKNGRVTKVFWILSE